MRLCETPDSSSFHAFYQCINIPQHEAQEFLFLLRCLNNIPISGGCTSGVIPFAPERGPIRTVTCLRARVIKIMNGPKVFEWRIRSARWSEVNAEPRCMRLFWRDWHEIDFFLKHEKGARLCVRVCGGLRWRGRRFWSRG